MSSYAHNINPNEIDKKLIKFGFRHPLSDDDIISFWNHFLDLFLNILSQLITELKSYRPDLESSKILVFEVNFQHSQIQYGEKNRIIFYFSNKIDKTVLIEKYKIDAFFDGKLIIRGGWGNYRQKIEPNENLSHSWGEVDPTTYYRYNKKGKWDIKTTIEFKLEKEDYPRRIENECSLLIK